MDQSETWSATASLAIDIDLVHYLLKAKTAKTQKNNYNTTHEQRVAHALAIMFVLDVIAVV